MANRQYFQFMFRDWSLLLGFFLIPIVLLIFQVTEKMANVDFLPISFGIYGIVIIYFLCLFGAKRLKKGRRGRNTFALYLTLCLISCFALNRDMELFKTSADWWIIALTICCINNIAFICKEGLPQPVRVLMAYLLGISLCCFLYLTIYLIPAAAIGIIASFFFGLSLHVFIPLLFVLYTLVLVRNYIWYKKTYRIAYLSGIGTVILVIIVYTCLWISGVDKINKAFLATDNNDLPKWELVARKVPRTPIVERILKSKIVYQTAEDVTRSMDGILWMPRRRNFAEVQQHDPLIMIASLTGTSFIDEDNAVKVLTAMYNSRQAAQERLWSGEKLSTIQVRTKAEIWPSLHMAYTEKTLTVYNATPEQWSWRNNEAIYTFHLPEGGVVTSLSLWINDKEEKGILTTKEKADSAYKTIVGVESRDPSVVHWQEGNTVTVRVFPVTPGKSRQFKIGITTPLLQQDKRLVYQNIWFEGPETSSAQEDVNVTFNENPVGLELPGLFDRKGNTLTSMSHYKADWEISMIDPGIRSNLFSANGKSFFVAPYKKEPGSADIRNIYLDLNQSWTKAEFNAIRTMAKDRKLWVFADNEMQPATDELFDALQQDQYSLFPVYKVPARETSLLITKGNIISPTLADLKDSPFPEKLKESLAAPGKMLLYNLGGELSPYLRTLKECRFFKYDEGDMDELRQHITTQHFPINIENDHRVVIEPAGITINMEESKSTGNAPDHLQRLFAYNHIMQAMGPDLLTRRDESDTLVASAREAYIVTPLSSLIVLETQKDYDRFDIHDSQNSLQNASIKGKGAVPEPHEWALILIGLGCIVYMKWFKKKRVVAI